MKFTDVTPAEQDAIMSKWLGQRLAPFYATLTLAQCRPVFEAYNPRLWVDTQQPERGVFITLEDGSFLCQDLRERCQH